MKRILSIIIAVIALAGCSVSISSDAPAYKFKGSYILAVHETGAWGASTVNDSYNINVTIRATSYDRVYMYGAFETYGTVDGNYVRFNSIYSEDSYGSLTTTFENCSISPDGILTMTVKQKGSILSTHDGNYLPFQSTLNIRGTK